MIYHSTHALAYDQAFLLVAMRLRAFRAARVFGFGPVFDPVRFRLAP